MSNLDRALATSAIAIQEWIDEVYPTSQVTFSLLTPSSARGTVRAFLAATRNRRKVTWDWERIFHKKVKFTSGAWMFALRRRDLPVTLCYGRIQVADSYVSIDYLERCRFLHGVKGKPLAVAFQFAVLLAGELDIEFVRINEPLNRRLATFYQRELGMSRHPAKGEVQYLSKRVKP